MRFKLLASATLMAAPFVLFGTNANATEFAARLVGFEEVPAIFSPQGKGTLDLDLNRTARTLAFTLSFSGLTSPALFSHIHFGKEHVNGSVTVFFCGGGGMAACPSGGGTVKGTITSANVIAVPAQGIPAQDFDALVAMLLSNTAYVNVHTTMFPAGEIRGQIRRGETEDDFR